MSTSERLSRHVVRLTKSPQAPRCRRISSLLTPHRRWRLYDCEDGGAWPHFDSSRFQRLDLEGGRSGGVDNYNICRPTRLVVGRIYGGLRHRGWVGEEMWLRCRPIALMATTLLSFVLGHQR
uniref:Uncharacterized protein n=1 Tax=Oryza glumipatula TaxID=40148 RepID=A0A0E0AU40_9ORYZ